MGSDVQRQLNSAHRVTWQRARIVTREAKCGGKLDGARSVTKDDDEMRVQRDEGGDILTWVDEGGRSEADGTRREEVTKT